MKTATGVNEDSSKLVCIFFYVAREGAENNKMKTVVSLLRANNYLKRQARLKFSFCSKGVTFVNPFDYFLIPKFPY